ncbi:maleylpyruvate isomerase family mycothiol-dependent enzyme [Streptomyces sp. NPDC002088]|uniref:maleylpyruvate isomerase family mycothiol-dependent enzyme n=1 Tax=Streptomyces sp. NPDC002088 TaxID=3154665 RepID=UPI00332A4B73
MTDGTRTFADAREWARTGTKLLLDAVAGLDEAGFCAPSVLPEWTRGHLAAHVAANADALCNLVHWAATGEETPMYASPEERAAGIAKGAAMSAEELRSWVTASAQALDEGWDRLTDEQWQHEVVTAQGRTVPATELPWMRAREVCIHAVDFGTGAGFADLPAGFLTALCDEVVTKRAAAPGPALTLRAPATGAAWDLPGDGEAALVTGELHDIAAYLTGRSAGPLTADGTPAPALGAWL